MNGLLDGQQRCLGITGVAIGIGDLTQEVVAIQILRGGEGEGVGLVAGLGTGHPLIR